MEIEEASVYNKAMIKPISGTKDRMKRDTFLNAYLFRAEKFYLKRKFSKPNNSTLPLQDDQFYKPR